jgi:hypothetical protein
VKPKISGVHEASYTTSAGSEQHKFSSSSLAKSQRMTLAYMPTCRRRRQVHLTQHLLRFVAIAVILGLVGCGSPSANSALPALVPAATPRPQAFPPKGATMTTTPTGAANISIPTATATATVSTPMPMTPDPRVRTNCVPPAATSPSDNLTGQVSVDIKVDLTPTNRLISPLIYGLAVGADIDYYQDVGTTVLRWGGNQVTRHNWEINASNAGSDWLFANVPYAPPGKAPGSTADHFIREAQSLDAEAILTIPAIGYVAKDGDNNTRSQNVPESGGPPLEPGSEAIDGYDPAANQRATSVKSFATKGKPFADPPDLNDGAVYQDEWVAHIVKTFGRTDAGGVRFYAIDNEPDLWSVTHRDIHPVQMGYDATLAMFKEYAAAIKAVDPSAQIVAPVLSGVTGMYYSALDRGDDNFRTHADRRAHGNTPFLPWFLSEVRRYDEQTGSRSLDVLAVHHYPQGGEYHGDAERDPETNARRLRATQQLWNSSYTDESWISRTEAAQLALIPRLRDWVNTYYPGTKIAITEWNYGADDTINGALTIVDVLGIFGREGLDIATYWRYPEPGTPGASAFKLYGNYDNCGRHFGDQLLTAQSSDHVTLSAFASRDSHSGDILIMTVNKLPNKAVEARFALDGVGQHTVQVYQFDQEHPTIRRLEDRQTEGAGFSYTVAPYAATLFVIKP